MAARGQSKEPVVPNADTERLLRDPHPDVLVQMFWHDHAPPHSHALYGEDEALIDIRTFDVIAGGLPRRALTLVREWGELHRDELMENWERCYRREMPNRIDPLS